MEKIFSWIIDITFIMLSIVFLVLASLSYDNYKYDTYIINEYKQNWELGPISDIVSVALNEKCPMNYNSFITNKFPGNKEGCDCRNSEKSQEKQILFDSPCSAKKLLKNCVSIYKQDDIALDIWKGKKLCAKRLPKSFWDLEELDSLKTNQNENFDTNLIEKKEKLNLKKSQSLLQTIKKSSKNAMNSSTGKNQKLKSKKANKAFKALETLNSKQTIKCSDSENYKPCGYLDETLNILCIRKSEACPINDILIMKRTQFERLNLEQKTTYNSINLSNEYYLYFTNQNTNGKVYVEVNVHVGNHYCVHPHEGILGQNNFLLNNLKGEKNCVSMINGKSKDTRYQRLDSYNMDEFYKENKIQKLIFDKIPDYNLKNNDNNNKDINTNNGNDFVYKQVDASNQIKLYASGYLGWRKTCFNFNGKSRDKYVSSMLDTSQETVESTKRLINWIRALTAVNLSFQIFVIVIVKIIWLKFKIDFRTIFYFDIVNFLFILVVFIVSFISHGKTRKILAPAFDFIDKKCGDEITNDVLSFAFADITRIEPYLLAIEVAVALQLLIYLGLYAFVFREKFSFGTQRERKRLNEDEDY